MDGYLVVRGRRLADLSAGEVVALSYNLIVESLKASAGEDYADERNKLEAALRPKAPRDAAAVVERAPLPRKLQEMRRPAWWNDDDDPLEGMPGRRV